MSIPFSELVKIQQEYANLASDWDMLVRVHPDTMLDVTVHVPGSPPASLPSNVGTMFPAGFLATQLRIMVDDRRARFTSLGIDPDL
jgi:hypothetical protein